MPDDVSALQLLLRGDPALLAIVRWSEQNHEAIRQARAMFESEGVAVAGKSQ